MDSTEELGDRLRRRGHAQRMVTTTAEAEAWRARAREAADKLGRPVQTTQGGLLVLAALKDWPANEHERQLTELQVGNAIKRMRIPIPAGATATSSAQ